MPINLVSSIILLALLKIVFVLLLYSHGAFQKNTSLDSGSSYIHRF